MTKAAVVLAAVFGGAALAPDADAHGRRHHHHHHHHRSHVGIWFGVPAPVYYPRYYYPRYYYPPAAVYYPPTTYIEQSPPPAAAPSASTAYWYYCRESQTYYPYVQTCPSPWQQVVPNSAPPG